MRPPFHTFVHLLLIGLLVIGAWRTPCTGKAMVAWTTTGEAASPSSDSPCPMHAASVMRDAADTDAHHCDHANGASCHCGIAQAALPCEDIAAPAPRHVAMPSPESPDTVPGGLLQRLLRPPIRVA